MIQHNYYDAECDARGLSCPLPLLRAKKALKSVTSGQILRVLTTDPASKEDFRAFCKQMDHELIAIANNNLEFHFYIKKI